MAILRLCALRLPFQFVNIAQHRYTVPLVLASWVLGSGAAGIEHHFWDHDEHMGLLYAWWVFIALTLVLFVVALVTLGPIRRNSRDIHLRRTANKMFVLTFFYMICFVCFGLMNVFKHFVCLDKKWNDHEWTVELFCNYGNFLTTIFVFPTVNSIANAVVISRAEQIQQELQSWRVATCVSTKGAYKRTGFNERI